MSVNLKELSLRLGLSPTTVSRALGGYSDVSATTKERVLEMARELGYLPNRAARQIAMGRADAVGIVYSLDPDTLGNPAFLAVMAGLSHRLERENIDLLLLAAQPESAAEMGTYERMVRGRRVDAAVVALTRVDDARIEYLLEAGLPFVAYGRSRKADRYPWFDFDNRAGGRLAVQQLVALGHKRIVCVHAPLQLNFARQRHDGFLQGMRAAGLAVTPDTTLAAGLDRRTGYAAGQRLLALKPRPTAVVVHNNLTGVGVIRALIDAGVAVGPELSVLVYDGVPPDTLLRGLDVAAILQPTPYESGGTLGEMVLALIHGQPMAQRHVLRQPVFEAGDSIAPPAR